MQKRNIEVIIFNRTPAKAIRRTCRHIMKERGKEAKTMTEYTDRKKRRHRVIQRVLEDDHKDTEEEIVEALYRIFDRD